MHYEREVCGKMSCRHVECMALDMHGAFKVLRIHAGGKDATNGDWAAQNPAAQGVWICALSLDTSLEHPTARVHCPVAGAFMTVRISVYIIEQTLPMLMQRIQM